jgi:hypothetical protein
MAQPSNALLSSNGLPHYSKSAMLRTYGAGVKPWRAPGFESRRARCKPLSTHGRTAGAKSKAIIIEMAKMWGHWAEAAKRKETNKKVSAPNVYP